MTGRFSPRGNCRTERTSSSAAPSSDDDRGTAVRDGPRLHRREVVDYLRSIADKLDGVEPITLKAGDRSVTVDPPERPTFEVKVERETSASGAGETSLELELEWGDDEEGGDGSLEVR